MAETLTTLTKLLVVRENYEDEFGTTLRFQQGDHGCLALSDANYESYLRLARRSQERQHPVGVSFGEEHTITEMIRADNDFPLELRTVASDCIQVLFAGHDGVFKFNPNNPESAVLNNLLAEALQTKSRVWFIAQKPDQVLLDVVLHTSV